MILQLNHFNARAASATTQEVVDTLYQLLEEGRIDHAQFARLQVQLDWVQYKQNFREMVSAFRLSKASEAGQSWEAHRRPTVIDIRIDTRQMTPDCLRAEVLRAIEAADSETPQNPDRIALEDFKPFRNSIVWEFNKFYWSYLKDWENATGRSYEQALPGGKSDSNSDEAVADSVGDFWTLLCDMETKKQLPAEIFILEIGVGTGKRCGLFVEKFRALDQQRGTSYYPRLRVLMADYSLTTLDMARPAVGEHAEVCSFLVLDALNPLKTLSFLRHKILYIHSSNMYDNLPDEEMLRRDGRLFCVHVRAYLPMSEAARIAEAFTIPVDEVRRAGEKLLAVGPDAMGDRACGVRFWQEFWKAIRLEERMVALEDLPDLALPAGLDMPRLEAILEEAPGDLRFHLSSGALESFVNTVPLLHPRGYLQVQDIFVTDLNEYRAGFHGPGKLDGSIVNWVNGALLKGVAERTGYDVHFAPYRYRKGSNTSILFTTPRE